MLYNKLDVWKMSALAIPMEVYPNLAQLEASKKKKIRVHRCLTEKCLQARGCFLSWKSLFLTRKSHGLRNQNRNCPPLVAPSTKGKGRCKLRRHRAQEKNHQKGKKEWMGTTTGNGLARIESSVYCHHTHPLEAGNATRNLMQHSSVLYQDDLLLFLYLGHKTNQSTALKKTASLCKMLEY